MQEKSRNLSGKQGEESMIWDKMSCINGWMVKSKNLEGKDRQRQLLYYETLIRACNKVVYQLVYKGKKFVFLKEPLYLINQ